MTDQSHIFNECLSKYNAQLVTDCRHQRRSLKDEFMKEAYTINSSITSLTCFLLRIRQAYLSTARPPRHINSSQPDRRYFTDQERDEVDFEAKSMIRQYMQVISNLETVEKQRAEIEKRSRKHTKSSWRRFIHDLQHVSDESDNKEESARYLSMHREGVIWLLRNKLGKLSDIQREQQETRVLRSIEKNKSMLQNSASMGGITPAQAKAAVAASKAAQEGQSHDRARYKRSYLPSQDNEEAEQVLSEEQLQIFAREGQDLLKQYEETLDQVRTAEKSLLEISELQTQLAGNLAVQSTYMDQLYADSIMTAENMAAGNEELKKATERGSSARMVFQICMGFCAFIIIADLIV